MIELKQAEIPMPDEKQLIVLDRLVRLFGVKILGRDELLMSIDFDYYIDIPTGNISLVGDRLSGNCQCHYELVVNYLIGKINGCSVGDIDWMQLYCVAGYWSFWAGNGTTGPHFEQNDIYTCLEKAADIIEAELAKNEPDKNKPEITTATDGWTYGVNI